MTPSAKARNVGNIFKPTIAASVRFDTSSFAKMRLRWDFTVLSVMFSSLAISRFVFQLAVRQARVAAAHGFPSDDDVIRGDGLGALSVGVPPWPTSSLEPHPDAVAQAVRGEFV